MCRSHGLHVLSRPGELVVLRRAATSRNDAMMPACGTERAGEYERL